MQRKQPRQLIELRVNQRLEKPSRDAYLFVFQPPVVAGNPREFYWKVTAFVCLIKYRVVQTYRGADKSLARPERKQATANKL
jgi:hypothetical protein